MIRWFKNESGECRRLEDVPKGATVDSVDGKMCMGICESCGVPVVSGDKYLYDSDAVVWHKRCPKSVKVGSRSA